MKTSGIITLTTDFGLSDPYVGIMKGVILSINPEALVVDISHVIKAGSIIHAAGLILEAYHFFPDGTVHVVVVDPGVGGHRRPILVKTKNYVFVGPDNGLFFPIIKSDQRVRIIHLLENKYFLHDVSQTFHGRDIFAPVAAHLTRGADPMKMGQTIADPVPLKLPKPEQRRGVLFGQIIRVDHFGNLITNIHRKDLERFLGVKQPLIKMKDLIIKGMVNTYEEGTEGETLALIGSSDYLEISVNLGRACDRLGLDLEHCIGVELEISGS